LSLSHLLSVAPMMERTDRHCRYLLRLISPNSWLYTEMITASALVDGGRLRLLKFHPSECPVALQLGGSDSDKLAQAAYLGAKAGYDEINLNVGCPSSRVQSGRFGASLMAEPATVIACIKAMTQVVDIPVTVKTRLGIDDLDSYEFLHNFIGIVSDAGCRTVIIHARKALLAGLSPKQNRQIPPLNYQRVYRLKKDYPSLEVILNGGLDAESEVFKQLKHVDGVMLGRQAYKNPYLLGSLDSNLFGGPATSSREAILKEFLPYIRAELDAGTPLSMMTRPLMGLYAGCPGSRAWRCFLGGLSGGEQGYELLQKFQAVLSKNPMSPV
jgi:tRNA-dihydrouridine synthase A